MKTTTILTTKGQLTIPQWIWEKLELKPGDHVDIALRDDTTFVARLLRPERPKDHVKTSARRRRAHAKGGASL